MFALLSFSLQESISAVHCVSNYNPKIEGAPAFSKKYNVIQIHEEAPLL